MGRLDIRQNGSLAMEEMVRYMELTNSISAATTNSITFAADINNDAANETVALAYDAVNKKINITVGGTTTILAMIAMTLYERRPNGGWPLLLPGFLAAVALHTGFNIMLVRPAFATLVTLVVLQLVIYLVFQHSERTLRSWLDTDSDSKVQLLETINSGTFLASHAGRYLRSLSDRFHGEALVDMLCLLRLHGELALRAKGVLLLRESGMEVPPLDEPTRDKLAELAELQRSIGKTGMLMLRPLMMASGKDMWQLTLLGK